jgi:hypothetical protein
MQENLVFFATKCPEMYRFWHTLNLRDLDVNQYQVIFNYAKNNSLSK